MSNFDNGGGFLTGINYEEERKPVVRPEERKKTLVLSKSKDQATSQVNRSSYIKKEPSKLPGINTQSKPKLSAVKSSINFYKKPKEEQYMGKVHNYLSSKQMSLTKNKKTIKDFTIPVHEKKRDFESPYNDNVTKEFLEARKQKIEDSMKRLYENDKQKITEKLNCLEKQNVFKSEVHRLEENLEDIKKVHNQIHHKIQSLTKIELSQNNTISAFEKKHNLKRDLDELEVVDELNVDTQNRLADKDFVHEQLVFKLEQYKSDLLAQRKNTQQLNQRLRTSDILKQDYLYEIDRNASINDGMEKKIMRATQSNGFVGIASKSLGSHKFDWKFQNGRNLYEASTKLDTVFGVKMEDELSLYEDRVILDQIKIHEDELENKKAEEILSKKIDTEQYRIKNRENEIKEHRKKNKLQQKEIDKRQKELTEVMVKMKVGQPEMVLSRVSEMAAIKTGLIDLTLNYKTEIVGLKQDIKDLEIKRKSYNIEQEPEKNSEKSQSQEELDDHMRKELKKQITVAHENRDFIQSDRLEQLEKKWITAKLQYYDLEHNYKRNSTILNDSCTTVSRIMYQLQNAMKDKNVEVSSSNVTEYLSHIGLKLERMLAFIYTKDKNIREEEITEAEIFRSLDRDVRISQTPQWLGLNPSTVAFEERNTTPDPRYINFDEDESFIAFENMRNELKNDHVVYDKHGRIIHGK